MVIDDFQVIDDEGYGYDNYGKGNALNLEYIQPICKKHSIALYYSVPHSYSETGSKRGCIILSSSLNEYIIDRLSKIKIIDHSVYLKKIEKPMMENNNKIDNISIMIPVYNDWLSLSKLIVDIDSIVLDETNSIINIIIVDDGSTDQCYENILSDILLEKIQSVRILRLVCNVGHQRALAIGLSFLQLEGDSDAVLIMDSDGEDRAEDLLGLLKTWQDHRELIIVAGRVERSEGFIFRISYIGYKWLFRVLTGNSISFGNFSIVPKLFLSRLVHMPEVWNNMPAAICRSRLPFYIYPTVRGKRYEGKSNMSFLSLLIHGLSAVSVFTDVVFIRSLLFSIGMMIVGIIGITLAIIVKVFTGWAIPGWTTTVVGIFGIILLQAILLSIAAIFLYLSSRSTPSVIPVRIAKNYISCVEQL